MPQYSAPVFFAAAMASAYGPGCGLASTSARNTCASAASGMVSFLAGIDRQQLLRWKSESIGNAVKAGKQRDHMNGLGNLQIVPSRRAQSFDIGWRNVSRVF